MGINKHVNAGRRLHIAHIAHFAHNATPLSAAETAANHATNTDNMLAVSIQIYLDGRAVPAAVASRHRLSHSAAGSYDVDSSRSHRH